MKRFMERVDLAGLDVVEVRAHKTGLNKLLVNQKFALDNLTPIKERVRGNDRSGKLIFEIIKRAKSTATNGDI
jgi:hypothetical protein